MEKIDWFAAQKLYSEGLTLEEIGEKVGVTRQTVSKNIEKDNKFSLYKLQVFFEHLVTLSDRKTQLITGYTRPQYRYWFEQMFTQMPYTQAIRCNGLGAIGDYVRSHKDEKEDILESLLVVLPNGERKLQRMIRLQNLQTPNAYSDRALGKMSYTDSLYQFKDEVSTENLVDTSLNSSDEIDAICRDYFSGQLDNVDVSRCLGDLGSLCKEGALYSVVEMSDFRKALANLDVNHRLTISLHYGELHSVDFESLYRAKEALRKEFLPLLNYLS